MSQGHDTTFPGLGVRVAGEALDIRTSPRRGHPLRDSTCPRADRPEPAAGALERAALFCEHHRRPEW